MTDVYKVWDPRRSTYLAMKALCAGLAEDIAILRRFNLETQTLANLQIPDFVW